MDVKFEIADDKVKNFSGNAKNRIIEQSKNYALDIINEAERIELSNHEDNSPSEVTSNHVGLAAKKFRSISRTKKKKRWIVVLKIVSDFLFFAAGIMFLPDKFVTDSVFNIAYFVFFLAVLTTALITTIVSHFWGGE